MNNAIRTNKSKKTVTFKDNVDIINVECYKEYNKMDDGDFNYMDYFNNVNTYAKAQQMNNMELEAYYVSRIRTGVKGKISDHRISGRHRLPDSGICGEA